MARDLNRDEKVALEALLDTADLASVLAALADLCDRKGAESREAWAGGDAERWFRQAKIASKAAYTVWTEAR